MQFNDLGRYGRHMITEAISYGPAPGVYRGYRGRRYARYGDYGTVSSDAQMVRPDSGDTSPIYYLVNGVKRHITTMDVVNALGGTGAVASVSAAALAATPNGAEISSVADVANAAALATNSTPGWQSVVSTITGAVPSSVLATVGLGPAPASTQPVRPATTGSPFSRPLAVIGGFTITPATVLGLGAVAAGLAYLSRKKGRG